MGSPRDQILARLRASRIQPEPDALDSVAVDPADGLTQQEFESRFIEEARAVAVVVHVPQGNQQAFKVIEELLGNSTQILGWEPGRIPLPGLSDWLNRRKTAIEMQPQDGIALGLTGVDAALATTGSLVLVSGPGRSRSASLLPDVHIAIVARSQIVANLEAWRAGVDAGSLKSVSNVAIVTGPSRTADIGMQLVMGAHGPREVHVIIVD